MKDNQIAWVNEISDSIADSRQAEKDRLGREKGMAIVAEKLVGSKEIEEIRAAFASVQVEVGKGKTMPLLDLEKHDPMAEFDSHADNPGSNSIGGDTMQMLMIQFEKIMEVQREMADLEVYKIDLEKPPFTDESGNSIYDQDLPTREQQAMIDQKNDRMARDLWQPLMREGIIPENMIPDKFSEVAQTFAGASEAYEERLQAHSENMSKADIFLEKFAPVKDIGGKAIAAAGSLASFAGTAAELAGNSSVVKDVKEAGEIIELIEVAFTATCDIVPLVVKERDGIKVMDVFNDALKSVLSGAGVDDQICGLIHGMVGGATRAASAGKALAEGDFEKAFTEFGNAITAGFSVSDDPSFVEIGKQISFAVARMGAAAKVTKALTKKPPEPGAAIQALLSDISTFVKQPEIKTVLKILADGAAVLPAAAKERDALKVIDFIGGAVAQSLQVSGVDPEIATAINTSIDAAISGANIGTKLAAGDVTGAFETLGDGIASTLGKVGDDNVAAIGALIKSNIAIAASAKKFTDAMGETPPNLAAAEAEVNKAIQNALGDGGFKSAAEALSGAVEEEGDEASEVLATTLAKIQEVTDSEVLAAANALAEIKMTKDAPITKEQLDALRKAKEAQDEKAARSEEEKLRQFMEEDDAAFAEMLSTGMTPADGTAQEIAAAEERRLKSIESMIAVVQRDKKIFDLAQKICTKGPQLIADMVPGMSLVSACAEMAFKIAEAVKHAEQLVIWMDSVDDASKAATVQMDAMINRYGLEKKHALRNQINIGIQAVKIAGEATKLSPAAPIGLAITSGAAAATATLALAWSIQDYAEMEIAWRAYEKALTNPQNRKAIRMALRKNATLSKYAMAYGATVEGNAIAKEAMRRCGLTESTLAQPETNVGKVVDYLEALYSDDPVVVRAVPVKNGWHPGDVELSYTSFSRFVLKATTDAEPPLGDTDVSNIKGALALADRSYGDLHRLLGQAEPGVAVDLEAEQAALDATQALNKALKAFKPTDDKGGPHKEMRSYADTLTAMAQLRWRELQKIGGVEDKKRKRAQQAQAA